MPTLSGPTGFAATANGSGYIVLTWSQVTGNTGYTLLRSTVSGDYSAPVTATVATNIITYTASTGLTLGTPYYFVAQTSNASGLGAYSAQATATPRTVPSTMSAPTLTAGSLNISVAYVAPTSSNGAAITSYSIQRSTVLAMTTPTTVSTLSNPYPSTGLLNGTMYYYNIAASNAAGLGVYSAVSSNTPAAVPAIVVISSTAAGSNTISLAWTAPANNGAAITSYNLNYSTDTSSTGFTSLSSGLLVSPFVATGLTNGSLYYFQMAASNVMGYGPYSLAASNTPRTVPSPITDLSANPSGVSTSLILSWVAPWNGGSAITGYRWYQSLSSGMTAVTSNATLITTLSTTVTPLVAGTTYYYQIVASNVAGFSVSSAVISNYPRAVPASVGTVTATSLNQSISLSWLATTASNGSPISSYLSEYSLSSGPAGWTTISSSSANTIVATGLSNGTSYYFRVSASNVAGYGPTSTVVTKIPYMVPDKVGAITVTPLAASVSLAWPTTTASNGTAITSYYYYWSVSGGAFTGVSNASNVYSAVKTLLTNGSTYNFYVAASNAAGFGLSSDVVTTIPRTVPGAPTSVAAAVRTFDSVTFTFVPPASNGGNAITSYIVTPLLDGTTAQTTVSGSSSPIIVSNVIPGRVYTYRIVASNDAGIGTSATSGSVITYYNLPVANPNGNTYTYYASNQPWSSKVIYNLNYADVEVKQTARSAWSISYGGLVDTLNYVRNIALTDRNVWIMDISYGAGLGNTYSSLSNNLSNGDVLKVGSGEYLAATEPTIIKSITLEGPPDRSAIFGVAPGVSTYCLKIQGDNITARNLTLTTCYAQTTYTRGDYLLLASGSNLTISGVANVIPSLSNILIENMTIVNPYTLNSTASELQYWRNRRGISFNSVSGLTIRNCTFPKTWNYDMTLASCRNVSVTSNTFYASAWSTLAFVTTAQIMMKYFLSNDYSEYYSSNINVVNNTYLNFGDTSITTVIANPSYGAGATAPTYITPFQAPIMTFQPASLSYAITYSSNAGSTVQIPSDFRYSFVSSPLLAYVARSPLDIPTTFWTGGASNVPVTDLLSNTAVYPPGYCPYSNRNVYLPTLVLSTSLTRTNVTVTVDPLIPYATYEFSLDSNVVQTSNVSGSYTFSGAGLADGQHVVSVTGTDGYVTSDSSTVYFTFDTTPPSINLLTVSTPDISGKVIVNFEVTDPAGVAIYTTYLNDVSYADSPSLPETVQLPFGVYDTYTIKVGAKDTLGNTGFSSPLTVVYAATPGQSQDIPVDPAANTIQLNIAGNVEEVPVVPQNAAAETVLSGTIPDGGYVFVKDPVTNTGSAVLFANTDIGNKAKDAASNGVTNLAISRQGGGGQDIATFAKVGTSESQAPITDTKTIQGQTVSGTVNKTDIAAGNTVIFGIQNSIPSPPQLDLYFKYVDPVGAFIPDGFEIYTEFEAPQFSRMEKVGINRSDDNQQTYSFDGYAYKKAGTVSTFSFTFVRNSDYRIAMAYGSGIGDPYIMTIQGNLYKIPPFNGPMRLYQGAVNGQLLTVNATTRIDDDKESMDGDTNAVIQTLTKPTGLHNFGMTDAMSFFEKIYIRFGSKSMIVNVYHNEFRLEGPETWEVKNAGRVEKIGNTFDFYSNLSARNYEISPCPGVTVRIGIIPIRSVRSSVDIFAPNMEGGNGAFVHRLSRKAMTLRKLASEAPVERRDCPIKRTLGEVFVCNDFSKEKQIPFVG
uniref:Fibronectin type-III domain-containing protein n=1 Tax=viral metagenome TaxID=1070528 RepID=A0A6C0HKF0_9ZZZZ